LLALLLALSAFEKPLAQLEIAGFSSASLGLSLTG
jgi:hypothetical protein